MQFVAQKGLAYHMERTHDFNRREALEPVSGDDRLLSIPLQGTPTAGPHPVATFYRIRHHRGNPAPRSDPPAPAVGRAPRRLCACGVVVALFKCRAWTS